MFTQLRDLEEKIESERKCEENFPHDNMRKSFREHKKDFFSREKKIAQHDEEVSALAKFKFKHAASNSVFYGLLWCEEASPDQFFRSAQHRNFLVVSCAIKLSQSNLRKFKT